jgi:glucose-1-phosphate adenylyltransferase
MKDVVTMILAGGQGSRLMPLTKLRSKPAVPIAGNFRLIDIPISNCLHSNLRKIFISTQFSSQSLHRHIFLSYRFDNFSKDYVTILSAQQTTENRNWYQGTADAVRQNLLFMRNQGDLVLILSGDHLYRMDYRKFIDFHLEKEADISISVIPVGYEAAKGFGVMKVNRRGRITSFMEKPQEKEQLDQMKIPADFLNQQSFKEDERTHLASMGIYVFNWPILKELLETTTYEDFGKQVIPYAITKKKVYGYFFDGYWEDIGTIKSFFDAHMDLVETLPKFNFYNENRPIYTHARFLPGAKLLKSNIEKSLLSAGSIVDESYIYKSIIGVRSRIGNNCNISNTVIMGADYFESDESILDCQKQGLPKIGIGNNCHIKNSIIDKNARIGSNVTMGYGNYPTDVETENYHIHDGIIVIPKNATIVDGTHI